LRIASIVPSLTELLFALELGPNVVARTGFCIQPRDGVRRVPKVGGTKNVNVAALLAARPTHLVVNIDENRRETIAALCAHIPQIVVTHPLTPDDNLDLYREFGRLFERNDAAARLAADYSLARDALSSLARDVRPLTVLYLIWKDPWFTVSRATYVSALLAGAKLNTLPVISASRYPILAADDPAWREADLILLSSEPYAFGQKHAGALSRALPAPKPVLLVDGQMLSWYGSRAIAGLRYLRELRARIDARLA
jgi:ABC-type Fe3+-hydroxamate transport system substrate-binding protein